jgi:aryl-alcohol dehydrogenase-like predicted oxidoreductase
MKKYFGKQRVREVHWRLGTRKEACSRGLVDFIGITSHKPRVLLKAVEANEFDTVLVPLNLVTRQALEELMPLAKDWSVGVAIMKPYQPRHPKS